MALHKDSLDNHILEAWIYANAADRISTSTPSPSDLGRVAFQQDNKTYWRLTGVSPTTWSAITTGGPAGPTGAAGAAGATGPPGPVTIVYAAGMALW